MVHVLVSLQRMRRDSMITVEVEVKKRGNAQHNRQQTRTNNVTRSPTMQIGKNEVNISTTKERCLHRSP